MADTKLSNMTAASALGGTELFYSYDGTSDVKITSAQIQNFTRAFAKGTITTAAQLLDDTVTWNAAGVAFTGWKLDVTNTASASGSLLMDLEVGSTSQFTVDKAGNIYSFGANINSTTDLKISSAFFSKYATGQFISWNDGMFAWTDNANPGSGTVDLAIKRKASGILEINNGTAGSYTGTALSTGSQTVAQLPSASTAGAGARSFVTDATATTFMSVVSGGGSNNVPVVSDGTNWLIG